jgi:hypothetical protein
MGWTSFHLWSSRGTTLQLYACTRRHLWRKEASGAACSETPSLSETFRYGPGQQLRNCKKHHHLCLRQCCHYWRHAHSLKTKQCNHPVLHRWVMPLSLWQTCPRVTYTCPKRLTCINMDPTWTHCRPTSKPWRLLSNVPPLCTDSECQLQAQHHPQDS